MILVIYYLNFARILTTNERAKDTEFTVSKAHGIGII